ncbi:uncharacterized protein BDR25DRAFT_132372 [Lindgomyces ingoldianus]|uniref:Uncharacterized protein n=1 Tax=Lindgomyces ingoldianus TaxID=673940 RepID=A0ACB6R2S6_9PLEO|nr:uncharacterized protein BDR25DRAFT_132372 [Lindgomyces ingoldianus]KAF2473476.1 hypothetical protein BDR25DRAFT_132372 [Lindgomyces ingoldianus]
MSSLLDFLSASPPGNATLIVSLPDGTLPHIPGLNLNIIGDSCPVLSLNFEHGFSGCSQATIHASSIEVVERFLRFIYTGSYMTDYDIDTGTCSLAVHAELYKLGRDFDLRGLQETSKATFLCQLDFSSSIPKMPTDLCKAVRFIYEHPKDQTGLLETLWHYCCSNFVYHRFSEEDDFRNLVCDVPEFFRDLVRTSFQRGFVDDGAAAIVQFGEIAGKEPTPRNDPDFSKQALGDFLVEVWAEPDGDTSDYHDEKVAKATKRRQLCAEAGFTLVHRPKKEAVFEDVSAGEASGAEGFMVVYRPRTNTNFTEEQSESESSSAGYEPSASSESQFLKTEDLEDSFLTIKPESSGTAKRKAKVGPTQDFAASSPTKMAPIPTTVASTPCSVTNLSPAEMMARLSPTTIAPLGGFQPQPNSLVGSTIPYGSLYGSVNCAPNSTSGFGAQPTFPVEPTFTYGSSNDNRNYASNNTSGFQAQSTIPATFMFPHESLNGHANYASQLPVPPNPLISPPEFSGSHGNQAADDADDEDDEGVDSEWDLV